jgi:hypothetical protein
VTSHARACAAARAEVRRVASAWHFILVRKGERCWSVVSLMLVLRDVEVALAVVTALGGDLAGAARSIVQRWQLPRCISRTHAASLPNRRSTCCVPDAYPQCAYDARSRCFRELLAVTVLTNRTRDRPIGSHTPRPRTSRPA